MERWRGLFSRTDEVSDTMDGSEDLVQKAQSLSVTRLARSIQDIGFECTHCGECCTSDGVDEHIATVFPDEVRALHTDSESWGDVARPMPFGVTQDSTETFEWSLQTAECGSCVFYDDTADEGGCTRYADRPLICQTYPFTVELDQPESDTEVVDRSGDVVAEECEGLGEDIAWSDAVALAKVLKQRAITETREEREVIAAYRAGSDASMGEVVYDSEGVKRPDGTPIRTPDSDGSR